MLNLYRGERDWPKWLKRKSYFAATRVLYAIIQEAETGRQVQPQQVTTISGAENKTPPRADAAHGEKAEPAHHLPIPARWHLRFQKQ